MLHSDATHLSFTTAKNNTGPTSVIDLFSCMQTDKTDGTENVQPPPRVAERFL